MDYKMTRIRNQSLLGVALIALVVSITNLPKDNISAQEQSDNSKQQTAQKLIGTWKLEKAENPGSPSGIGTRLKMFNGTDRKSVV